MMARAVIHGTSAVFMVIGAQHHRHVCTECAAIRDDCAARCAEAGGLEACAEACRRCAGECPRMAG